MLQLSDSVAFWGSGEGIALRFEMLGGAIKTGSYNNALQVAAPIYGVQYFKMAGPQPKCEYCIKYYGRIYRQGMFMPQFPAHPNCFHEWDVWFPWEKESEFAEFWNQHTNLNNCKHSSLQPHTTKIDQEATRQKRSRS